MIFNSKQTFKIGSVKSSGSKMTDLEQTLNEPRIFLEGKEVTDFSKESEKHLANILSDTIGDVYIGICLKIVNSVLKLCECVSTFSFHSALQ